MSLTCGLCCRIGKLKKTQFTTVIAVDVEEKIKQSYEDINGIPLSTRILNEQVHKQCYWKYFNHYTYTSKNKLSSSEGPNCLSTSRVPLGDRTNYRLPSSLSTTSTNQHSQQNSVNEAFVFADLTYNSSLKTSSFTRDHCRVRNRLIYKSI